MNDHHAFVLTGHIPGNERIGRVHQRNSLEVDVGMRELRHDVVHVIVHPIDDGLNHGILAVAALMSIPMDFLDPLQIDNGYHTNQQVNVLGNVVVVAHHPAMEPLVEQGIGIRR